MTALLPIRHRDDILPAYRGTPVADLVAYHNLRSPHRSYDQAKILIGMCMDSRITLRIHDNFAYILRAGLGTSNASSSSSRTQWPSAEFARSASWLACVRGATSL